MSSEPTSQPGDGNASSTSLTGPLRESLGTAVKSLRTVATKVQDSDVMHDVTSQAESVADIGKQRLAEYVRAVGGVVAQSAYSLKETGLGGLGDGAHLLERAGTEAERFADTLNARGSRELMADAEIFARAHPLWFLGAAFAAGFGVARALKTAGADGASSGAQEDETVHAGAEEGAGHVQ